MFGNNESKKEKKLYVLTKSLIYTYIYIYMLSIFNITQYYMSEKSETK